MQTAAISPSPVVGAANPSLAAFSSNNGSNARNPTSAPTFSQVFAGSKAGQSPMQTKPTPTPRQKSIGSQDGSQSSASTQHAPKDSATQPGSTPAQPPSAPMPVPVTVNLAAIAAQKAGYQDAADDVDPPNTATPSATTAQTAALSPSGHGASSAGAASITTSAATSSTNTADTELPDPVSILPTTSKADASSQTGDDAGSGAVGLSSDEAGLTPTASVKSSPHAPSQQQTRSLDASVMLPQLKPLDGRNVQVQAQINAEQTQNHESSSTNAGQSPSLQATQSSENVPTARESIAQRIQPNLPNLDSTPATGLIQASSAAKNANSGGSNPGSNAGSGHSSGQSTNQTSTQSYQANNTKLSTNSDSQQSSSSIADTNAAATQQAATVTAVQLTAGSSTVAPAQVIHAAAQAAALADGSSQTSTATKASSDIPSTPAPTLAPALPRSLNDVTQATQLYQRVGGAEMHISMDTDLLGSIDLRAVVHQGSLSATIGVQRGDVQTLLVNELPALQHSLAEKNLQVGQISVLAGSIGSGANPNSQAHDQQPRQNLSAPAAPIYRDDVQSVLPAHTIASEVASLNSNSGRLSVIA